MLIYDRIVLEIANVPRGLKFLKDLRNQDGFFWKYSVMGAFTIWFREGSYGPDHTFG